MDSIPGSAGRVLRSAPSNARGRVKATDRYIVAGVTCAYDGAQLPVANLSVGGFFAVSDRRPIMEQVLSLELNLGPGRSFPVLGKVTWLNDAELGPNRELPAGFGVKILRVAFPDKLAILDVLKRLRLGSPS